MPVKFSQQDRQTLLKHLKTGRNNAIGASDLATLIGFPTGSNQARLRALIKECIEHDGDLIGAAIGKPNGFFIISNVNELDRYLATLENRIMHDNDRRTALINNWHGRQPTTTAKILTIS